MTFRYIGSKARLVGQIAEHIGPWTEGYFVDAFCGTGSVAEAAAQLGWPVRLNDQLLSATTMAAARLISSAGGLLKKLGGYENALHELEQAAPRKGFIWRAYSPASLKRAGVERRYFSERNAAKIDGIRAEIRDWSRTGRISRREEILLIGDLLSAANRVANIAGTYGCFLAKWTPQAAQPLELRPRDLKHQSRKVCMSNVEASQVEAGPDDLVYLDPPYTKRQYASYYHILETIARGDEPVVEGVAGLRPWRNLASAYCYKVKALQALTSLVSGLQSRRILLSYSNEGHVDLDLLRKALAGIGSVRVHELASVGRYRPNVTASAKRASVNEFLITIDKAIVAVRCKRELAVA